ncbi:hypothetical protein CEXT_32701 [Caerostris extrusa]|uniref:Uncharacterized protein n=1 Tax=Caerostris extrusa TaxID=172846 RepID=A0AAV4SGR8_CAEEX|nr:hypothetical protein CEXT_32701 [Caerostris extrusa]
MPHSCFLLLPPLKSISSYMYIRPGNINLCRIDFSMSINGLPPCRYLGHWAKKAKRERGWLTPFLESGALERKFPPTSYYYYYRRCSKSVHALRVIILPLSENLVGRRVEGKSGKRHQKFVEEKFCVPSR